MQPDSGLLALFRHSLLARYFVVTALLCTVMAICFYTINLATDSLQVRVLFGISPGAERLGHAVVLFSMATASSMQSSAVAQSNISSLARLATNAGLTVHQLLPHLNR